MMRPDLLAQMRLAIHEILTQSHGQLPRRSAVALAGAYGVSLSKIYREAALIKQESAVDLDHAAHARLLAGDDDPDVPAGAVKWWQDDTLTQTVCAALGGSPTVASAWRRLHQDGTVDVTYPTFTQQLKQYLPPAVHAGLTTHGSDKGRNAYIATSLYCTDEIEGRNTRWQSDVQYVPVRVRTPTGNVSAELYQITFIDEATRRVMSTMFTNHRPTGADVAATLVAGIKGHTDADGVFYGGIPRAVLWDNGGEFLNDTVTRVCAQLGILPIPAPPHTGWRKGKIERFHLTMQKRFFSTLPGATQGPKTFTGRRPWQGDAESLMFFDTFVVAGLEGVRAYNEDHKHSAIKRTPTEMWKRTPGPITQAAPAALHPLMLALPETRIVGKDGICYQNTKYISTTLRGWRRRSVEVRVLPHEVGRIWVFNPDTKGFICEAVPAGQLSATERQLLLSERAHDYEQLRDAIAAGTADRAQEALVADILDEEERLRANAAAADPAAHPDPVTEAGTVEALEPGPAPPPGQPGGPDDDLDIDLQADGDSDFLDMYGDDL